MSGYIQRSIRTEDVGIYRVRVLERALRILDVLGDSQQELGPTELSSRLGLHKSTIHRLLVVLERHRLIRRTPPCSGYVLGMKLFELGSRAVEHLKLHECAQPFLLRLVNETRETAHICVPSGTQMLSIANVPGPGALQSPSTVGTRSDIHCTSAGKAFSAFLPKPALDELLAQLTFSAHTQRTITTLTALKTELERVRIRGFAVDNEEAERGVRCVGAPVWNHSGRVVASVSVDGPVRRLPRRRIPEIGRIVVQTAADLSKQMGYDRPAVRRPAQGRSS